MLGIASLLLWAGTMDRVIGAEPPTGNGAADSPLSFESDIRPILKTHCFHCHGAGDSLKGDLDLRLRRFMDKKSDSGTILNPGHPESSRLFILTRDGEMPKGEKRLSEAEVQKIGKWIAAGARTLRPEPTEIPKGFFITEEDRSFWSFQPVRQVTPPTSGTNHAAWVRNPVDAFLLQKLEPLGLSFAPEADRLSLIRRVYFDLLGLPPSPEAVQEFVKDSAPDAYERLVDRVLQKPEYGERWGRHWLDVAGYSDSNGYAESDSIRPHAWRYRDYVIRSFNQDKPFDQFIVEQLAGDELAGICTTNTSLALDQPRVQECLVATGFLRMAPDGTGDGPTDPGLARNQVIAETIKIVSSSLLGITVGCAQCHDHRYDPISQVDYYRFRAIFDPAFDWKAWRTPAERAISLYLPSDRKKSG